MRTLSARCATMKNRLVPAVVLFALAAVAADEPPADLKLLEGTWDVVGYQADGRTFDDSFRERGMKITFKGNTVVVQANDVKDEGTFTVSTIERKKADGKTQKVKTLDTTRKDPAG